MSLWVDYALFQVLLQKICHVIRSIYYSDITRRAMYTFTVLPWKPMYCGAHTIYIFVIGYIRRYIQRNIIAKDTLCI